MVPHVCNTLLNVTGVETDINQAHPCKVLAPARSSDQSGIRGAQKTPQGGRGPQMSAKPAGLGQGNKRGCAKLGKGAGGQEGLS